jgi:thioredoxin-like negative regulator of GroEL
MTGNGPNAFEPHRSGIPERTGGELLQMAEPAFVLVYTPLCGTCKLAIRMLEIVLVTAPHLKVYLCNLNLSPQLAERWRIESVPCLARMAGGEAIEKLYRMASVGDLFAWLQRNADNNET